MPVLRERVVLDTNILVRGLLDRRCDSGRILSACESRRIVPLLNKALLSEYRTILGDKDLVARYPQLNAATVKTAIERLMYFGDVSSTAHVRFDFERDKEDEKLIVLAIVGRASHLITTDTDLLDIQHGHDGAATRFRRRLPMTLVLVHTSSCRATDADWVLNGRVNRDFDDRIGWQAEPLPFLMFESLVDSP